MTNSASTISWDNPLESTKLSSIKNDYSDTVETIVNESTETIETSVGIKHGNGKPYRKFIVGDIKSDPNK
jgi:hypothetical protein